MPPAKIALRFYKASDAEPVFKMVTDRRFKYLPIKVKTVRAEKAWIKSHALKRKNNREWNYAVWGHGEILGGIGLKIDQHRPYIGELGYWVSADHWGRGIATQSVKLAEQIGFGKLKLRRLEILMQPANKASEKVAIKGGYKKEGRLKKKVKGRDGRFYDVYLYAKVL
jgi:ribosomal-protein-alanine N-acetyltransferase